MIASDVKFLMNGVNYLINANSTFLFSIFGNVWENAIEGNTCLNKSDINIGNDV